MKNFRTVSRIALFSGLLALSLSAKSALAQTIESDPSTTAETAEQLNNRRQLRSAPVVLAHPMLDTVPNFLDDLDSHLMSDELVNQLEDKYAMKLQSYSLQYGLILHERDSKAVRSYYGTAEEELKIRNEMARSIKQYMLVRGIPRFLTSKESTRTIGETYTKAAAFAQNAARVDFKNDAGTWAFNAGINPISTKAWAKYSNKNSTLEAYNFFNQDKTLAIIAFTRVRKFIPKLQYLIEQKAIEPGVKYIANINLEAEFRTHYPFASPNPLYDTVSYISAQYRF